MSPHHRTTVTFSELLAHPEVDEVLELRSAFGFMAFHGGLEGGTREIAIPAAERAGASLYAVIQPGQLRWHVPSHQVTADRSPALAAFLEHVDVVVAVHGYGRRARPTDILLGGGNRDLARDLAGHLRTHLPEFEIIDELDAIPAEMRGVHPKNPVNRARRGGVQLELPPRARGASLDPADRGRPCTPAPGVIEALAELAAGFTGG